MTVTRALLVVTEDGHAKRVPLADVPVNKRGRLGARLSSSPVAAIIELAGIDDDLVIVTSSGKVERIAVSSIPVRRRRVTSRGVVTKGPRIVTLINGDRVAAVALAEIHAGVHQTLSKPVRVDMWPWDPVGLRDGERIANPVVLYPPRPLREIKPAGLPVVARDEWAQTDVHKASTYYCAHCAHGCADPHAAYACIDGHATSADACSVAA